MKIITWNVNGLRAAARKGALDWIATQEAEAVCLQEVKARPEQLELEHTQAIEPYQAFWNPAERLGYSGVLTLTRLPPIEVQYGLQAPEFDTEGRVVVTRHPFEDGSVLLFNIYFPNGQRDFGRLTYKLNFYAHLLELCDKLHKAGERVILCGDFNTAHCEIDLRHPKSNAKTSGFLPEERAWISLYLEHGFVDAYRALYPDRVEYTWWTYRMGAREKNVGWRLDYHLVSAGLLPKVQEVVIHANVPGSDHCPVALVLGST
jgi:exodeoxyribonuclease-3